MWPRRRSDRVSDLSDDVSGRPAVGERQQHDGIYRVFRGEVAPQPFDDARRVDQRAIHIEQHSRRAQFDHYAEGALAAMSTSAYDRPRGRPPQVAGAPPLYRTHGDETAPVSQVLWKMDCPEAVDRARPPSAPTCTGGGSFAD
jgi:hypothetical protein